MGTAATQVEWGGASVLKDAPAGSQGEGEGGAVFESNALPPQKEVEPVGDGVCSLH